MLPSTTVPIIVFVGGLLGYHIKVILLQEAEVLPRLAELALLHARVHVVVDISALRIHGIVFLRGLQEGPAHGDVVADHSSRLALDANFATVLEQSNGGVLKIDLKASR